MPSITQLRLATARTSTDGTVDLLRGEDVMIPPHAEIAPASLACEPAQKMVRINELNNGVEFAFAPAEDGNEEEGAYSFADFPDGVVDESSIEEKLVEFGDNMNRELA